MAALNLPGLVDGLRARSPWSVVVVLSPSAHRFVTADAITQAGGASFCFDDENRLHENTSTHIWLAERVVGTLVFPASADFIASMAYGHGRDLATTTMLAVAEQPVMVVPVMHGQMWSNPFVRENLVRLQDAGYRLKHTESGISPSVPDVVASFLGLLAASSAHHTKRVRPCP